MITIRTQGGLGNQMFQYAAALAQAERLGVPLEIDSSMNGLNSYRPFNLSLFNIPETIVGERQATYHERGVEYSDDINDVVDDSVLVGYFQSELYFNGISSLVRQRLTPPAIRPELGNREALTFFGDILAAGRNATMVGIRRGDYVEKAHYHGVMPDAYYTEALSVITSEVTPEPVLFIFTDDPDWVESNLVFPYESHLYRGKITVPGRIGTETNDLALMSYCNSAIISNSSFHWWGAWLRDNKRTGKVVAPMTWFTDAVAQSQSGDIVPDRWFRV
jgi:hypothetical protein